MRAGEPVSAGFNRLAGSLTAQRGELLGVMIYGSVAARDEIDRAMRTALGEAKGPVPWIEGFSCDGGPLARVQAFAASGRAVTRVRHGNRIVGSVFEDEGASHCLLGARNADGAALAVAAWEVRPIGEGVRAKAVGSPLQCPAPAYGRSFSRAIEIDSGGWRRLLVAGNASIHPGGKTARVGDPKKQVDLTMEVIGGFLQSRTMDYRDVTRATAYHRDPSYQRFFNESCAERNLEAMPVVHTHCVVCRDDLLFEIERDACAQSARASPPWGGGVPRSSARISRGARS